MDQLSVASGDVLNNTRALEAKLSEARSKKETLKARAASAKTSQQIQVGRGEEPFGGWGGPVGLGSATEAATRADRY